MQWDEKKTMVVAGVVSAVAITVLIWQLAGLRPGGKAPDQVANPVICIECGWTGHRTTEKLPQKCPDCGKMSLHFAGICPDCGEWTAWDLEKERELYANPRLFIDRGPGYFFPKCHACGAQTNRSGEKPRNLQPPGMSGNTVEDAAGD
jgi:hypothetical protein